MARRGDIAALGVLAALGAGILENKRNKDKVPVESLESQLESKPKAKSSYDEEHVFTGPMESKAAPTRSLAPAKTQAPAKAESKPSTQGYTRGKEQLSDYQMRQARDLEKGKTRGRPAEGAPRTTTGWTMPSGTEERKRLEEVDQPIERVYPEQMIGAPGLKTLHAAAKSLAGRGAGKELATQGSRALAEAETPVTFLGRSGARDVTPAARVAGPNSPRLTYEEAKAVAGGQTSPRLPAPTRRLAGPEERALSEADWTGGAVGYKKGGSAKPAAKGWGKARGARQAKYY